MLSLDGKANRLATMIRNNLGAAMQGLAVIPLFAGFDLDATDPARVGRIFSFDVAGGVYEETGYDAIGSGSLFAKSALKKMYRPGVDDRRGGAAGGRGALRRRRRRHRDRRTGPDPQDLPGGHDRDRARARTGCPTRRPARWREGVVAARRRTSRRLSASAVTDPATRRRRTDTDRARRPHAVAMQFYASPEQIMRDRSEFARKSIARGRNVVVLTYADGVLFVAENLVQGAAQGQRDLRPDRVRRGRPLQRVREPAGRRRTDGRPARLLLRPARRDRPGHRHRVRPDARLDLHRVETKPYEVEICIAEVGTTRRPPTSSTGSPTTARPRTSRASSRWAARPTRISNAREERHDRRTCR